MGLNEEEGGGRETEEGKGLKLFMGMGDGLGMDRTSLGWDWTSWWEWCWAQRWSKDGVWRTGSAGTSVRCVSRWR